ncbi:alkaline phosphatase [Desulfocicer vacuolatum]|nr:alkaline phosphatase [Desulfocicer vacuolatum]
MFLFIGDGMGINQRTLAAQFADHPLCMDKFPSHGITTTSAANRFITDSAAAATALACGEKTNVGVLGLDHGLKPLKSIAEMARDRGMKVGVITTVSLDNATPAGFYAHVASRKQYYDIALALTKSNFDYFAGGGLVDVENKRSHKADSSGGGGNKIDDTGIQTSVNALDLARKNGYTIVTTRGEFLSFAPGDGKLIVMPGGAGKGKALPYELDRQETDISLARLTQKGIELLQGESGFFMMVEGGKIDWACHANDAATAVADIIAFDDAIGQALEFYEKHPEETLIVVTADHECGGMSLGVVDTGYETNFKLLEYQKMSFQGFRNEMVNRVSSKVIPPSFEDILPLITSSFGLGPGGEANINLSSMEMDKLKAAYGESVSHIRKKVTHFSHKKKKVSKRKARQKCPEGNNKASKPSIFYGREDPLTVTLTRMLNHRAGIGWTTFSHTGIPVLTSAIGPGHGAFSGMYDNSDIGKKLMVLMGKK